MMYIMVTYVDIEAEDWILLAGALQACYLRLELVLGLRSLLSAPMVALRLSLALLALRRSLLLLLGCLAILPLVLRLGSSGVAILRSRIWSVMRVLVAHVAIVLRILSIWRGLWRKRRGGDVAGGRLAEARPVVLRR